MIDDELELEATDEEGFFTQDGPGLFGDDSHDPDGAVFEPVDEDEPIPLQPPPRVERGLRQELPDAPLALYRRYRPESFAEVIGQEHVTDPISRALTNNRVNHAYLFSGPRGCGKTTSARILARALNCDNGPTPEPCGQCQSCRDLARGGTGSIDVIEIDAASHGGVDDARELRERAFFAPVHSRYKIYIIDEAHMVTTVAFNALLKLVEEPPPHVKFIFATTEPDKVIGTIRSRTHHYPFRLVPPKVLTAYLGRLCEAEKVEVEPAVLPLVVRAGAGSVRDSLSVLDQLLGAADHGTVGYEQAATLLGYTPDTLLDEVMDAFAAGDGRGVFAAIDKVIEVGQDPRRFAEDLLRRLRDLVIVAAVPDALSSGLIDVAADQADRLEVQAKTMGSGELTRAAEVIATGLTEMRGTTAPRLHLELMCSRVLLPGADVDGRGVHARLDRLERRLADTGVAVGGSTAVGGSPAPDPVVTEPPVVVAETRRPSVAPTEFAPEPTPVAETPADSPTPGAIDLTRMRHAWAQVLEEVRTRRKYTYALLSQNCKVLDLQGNTLTLGFTSAGTRDSFGTSGSHDVLRDSLVEVLGADLTIEAMVDGGGPEQPPLGRRSERRPAPRQETSTPVEPGPAAPPTADKPAHKPALEPTHEPAPTSMVETEPDELAEPDDIIIDDGGSATDLIKEHLGAELIHEEER